jgi:Leucine-rich repeat (LRR) protein
MLKSEKLYLITFLEEITDKKRDEITEANLSSNYVSNIDVMAKYPNLLIIDASDNYISSINFKLPRLTKLILRNNFLEQIPNLS